MFFTSVLLAITLAVDAFAVSVALGIQHRKIITFGWMAAIAGSFGLFQAVMPLIGWLLGAVVLANFERYDFWISSVLLAAVGANMVRNAWRDEDDNPNMALSVSMLLMLGVATSLDALAVGFTLPTITVYPVATVVIIGVVTAVLCFVGLKAAHKIPKKFANPAELGAGVVLILLGAKILLSGLL